MKAKVVPMPATIHAGMLHRAARSYVEAARVLGRDDPQQMIGPRYFLLCHGLELSLKSFLAMHGYDKRALSEKIGHDLDRAYKKAKAKPRFPSSDELLQKLVRLMSPEHKKHRFRYPGTRWEELPDSNQCCDAIDRLLDHIEGIVKSASLSAQLKLLSKKIAWDPDLELARPVNPRQASRIRKPWHRKALNRAKQRRGIGTYEDIAVVTISVINNVNVKGANTS